MPLLKHNYRDVYGNPATEDEYIDSWVEAKNKLEKILGCRVLGFDPSFMLNFPDIYRNDTISKHLGLKIIEAVEEREEELKELRDFYLAVQDALVVKSANRPTGGGDPVSYYDKNKIDEALINCRPNYD